MNKLTAKQLSVSGILIALTVITLFFATILPTNRLSLYALSSFYISIIIIEFGIKTGWIFYASTCLLGAVVLPNKLAIIPFIIFFGVYGIIKLYIERINKIVIEYILKLGYFNLCITISMFLVKEIFYNDVKINLPLWVIISGLEVLFFIYDYVYTIFIQYYNDKLKKLLKI